MSLIASSFESLNVSTGIENSPKPTPSSESGSMIIHAFSSPTEIPDLSNALFICRVPEISLRNSVSAVLAIISPEISFLLSAYHAVQRCISLAADSNDSSIHLLLGLNSLMIETIENTLLIGSGNLTPHAGNQGTGCSESICSDGVHLKNLISATFSLTSRQI